MLFKTGRSATLHEWRKELKTLWYQLRLAVPLTRGVGSLVGDLERLETGLGDDHNFVVLGATLRGYSDLRAMRADVRTVEDLATRMRQSRRKRSSSSGAACTQESRRRLPDGCVVWRSRPAHSRPRREVLCMISTT